MHVGLPRLQSRWRQLAKEVGVIVLGVLLALGAQQAVESIQSRSDERALRDTLNHEIGLNLFVYDVRARQLPCIERRTVELDKWLDRAREGEQVPPLSPRDVQIFTPYRAAWNNRDA